MATKNIEININNGNGYDVLYPKTMLANISDWNNSVYSKSQTYSKTEIDELLKDGGSGWSFYGSKNIKLVNTYVSGDDYWDNSGTVDELVPNQDLLYKDWMISIESTTIHSFNWVKSGMARAYIESGECVVGLIYKSSSQTVIPERNGAILTLGIYEVGRQNSVWSFYRYLGAQHNKNYPVWGVGVNRMNLDIGILNDNTVFTGYNISLKVNLYWRKSPLANILM